MPKLSILGFPACPARLRHVTCVAAIALALSAAAGAQDTATGVSGHERLTWNQSAQSAALLAGYEFLMLIDAERIEAARDVRCLSEPQAQGFECSARLPVLDPGPHTIELAARRPGGYQGPWSAPLRVIRHSVASVSPSSSRGALTVEGARLEAIPLADPLDISSLAPLPDGRVLAGEKSGRILVIHGDRVSVFADLRTIAREDEPLLLAMAAHRDFAVNRSIVIAYAVRAGLRVARLTESTGAPASHEVIREGLPIDRRAPAAAVAIGPDLKIYVATGGTTNSSDPYSVKVLRLNADGSTPADSWPAPIFAEGSERPVALSWSGDDRTLWMIGVGSDGTTTATAIGGVRDPNARGVVQQYALPNGAAASAVRRAGDLDELIVSADDGRSLLRLSSDATANIVASEWLLRNRFDGIVAVVAGQANTVWVAMRDRLIRVTLPR